MNRRIPVTALSAALASVLLAACAGRPTTPPELVRLDQQLSNIQSDSRITANAPELVREAASAVGSTLAGSLPGNSSTGCTSSQ